MWKEVLEKPRSGYYSQWSDKSMEKISEYKKISNSFNSPSAVKLLIKILTNDIKQAKSVNYVIDDTMILKILSEEYLCSDISFAVLELYILYPAIRFSFSFVYQPGKKTWE